MPDNITISQSEIGTGVTIATNDIEGIHHVISKQSFGADGEQVPVSEASPLPVKSGSGDLTIDAWGVQKVSIPASLFHGLWTFDISPKMWFMFHGTTQVYSSSNIVSSSGLAQLTADSANSTVHMESKETPRYQPNRGLLYSDSGLCPDKTNGIVERGLIMIDAAGNIENGVFFRKKTDGLLYACLYSGGSQKHEILIPAANLPVSFDIEKNNIFDIQGQWRSAGNIGLFIGDPDTGKSKLVYLFDKLGTLDGASIENPAMPACCRVIKGAADTVARWGCADITSENGKSNNREEYSSTYTKNYSGAGADFPVIVVRQPLTINGKPNTRTVTLARITLSATKRTYFEVWVTRDPAAIAGATYKAIGGGSFVESDSTDMDAAAVRSTAVNQALLEFVTFVRVEANKRTVVDNPYKERIEFALVRGDYLVVTCNDNTAAADAVVEIGEQV